MPSLREVQHAIQRSVILRDYSAAAAFIVDDGLAPEQRLALYGNTFVSILTTALRLSFPAIYRLVGVEFFEGAAQIFVHEQPPHGAYLDEYGAGVPEFLARFPPAASLTYLPDVARLEWAVNCALHATDVEALDVARLAGLEGTDHDRVCFAAHPSVSLLRAEYPVDVIWRAVLAQDDAALAEIELAAGPVWLMVQRLATGVDVTRIDERAWRFATRLFSGQPLGVALDAADGLDAPALLAEHIAAGRLIAFSFADAVADLPAEESLS